MQHVTLQVGRADDTCFNALNPRNAVSPQRAALPLRETKQHPTIPNAENFLTLPPQNLTFHPLNLNVRVKRLNFHSLNLNVRVKRLNFQL
ncbi:hypothetical protein LC593_06775 [Nostoc sp. CHAB 5844]|nr:hypothetical protein [Nostoc sp. CHAB 5844]